MTTSVLIVDDEPDSSEFLVRLLRRHGYEAASVTNGRDAISQLVNRTPDVLVLDVRMPEMDGVSLLQVLRSYLRWYSLPVVLVTAHASADDLEKARGLGVRHVFRKAEFSLPDLLACLRQLTVPADVHGGAGTASPA